MDLIVLDNDHVIRGDIEAGFGSRAAMEEEKIFVAVGKEVKESENLLLWAIQNSGGRIISIVHVHQPDDFIPILGKKCHWTSLDEQQVRKYRVIERKLMLRTLDEYLQICRQFEVQAEKLYIEMDNVEKGLMQLIAQYNIEKLVMGAASDNCYHMKMTEPKSKKAIYLQLHAPVSCHIWFVCKGHLVLEREASPRGRISTSNAMSIDLQMQSLSITGQCNKSEVPLPREGTSRSVVNDWRETKFSNVHNAEVVPVSHAQFDLEANCHDWDETLPGPSRSQLSDFSPGSSSRMSRDSVADQFELFPGPCMHSSSSLAQENSSESLYLEELRKRQQIEEELLTVKIERDRLREDLEIVKDQNLILETKVTNYDQVMKDLEEGILSNVELLQLCEKERDELKTERDNVLKTAEELLNQSAEEASSSRTEASKFFTTLSFAEIEEATTEFDPSLQLWEGETGSIYKGVISHTQVTVRMWHPEGLHGPREFHQEVEILSKHRHPNLITLMAVCPEAWALVYEHLPNGTLKDRLYRMDNTPPLSWKTRIKIATEICSALTFLHSRKPLRVIHGALKPSCILLDSNLTAKISDLGSSHVIPHSQNSMPVSSSAHATGYTDPNIVETGEVSPAVDVYSFGVVLMELLTGNPPDETAEELRDNLAECELADLLDDSAGEWPYVQAKQLAQLAVRCCEENPTSRPGLEHVWRVLEPMTASCNGPQAYYLGDQEHRQPPSYFICPIFQEVMKDPQVAADGYTYEAEALRGWLETGHDTSPMTNLQLEHNNLVPNHALRSAIQEWLQHR